MLTLKYRMPALVTEVMEISALSDEAQLYPGRFSLSDCPLQGKPTLLNLYARELGRITTEIRRQLTTVT
ncbi:hypothetical protein FAP59_17480 [Morganella morganii]|nr:hypothetical protein [Morganella morganii]